MPSSSKMSAQSGAKRIVCKNGFPLFGALLHNRHSDFENFVARAVCSKVVGILCMLCLLSGNVLGQDPCSKTTEIFLDREYQGTLQANGNANWQKYYAEQQYGQYQQTYKGEEKVYKFVAPSDDDYDIHLIEGEGHITLFALKTCDASANSLIKPIGNNGTGKLTLHARDIVYIILDHMYWSSTPAQNRIVNYKLEVKRHDTQPVSLLSFTSVCEGGGVLLRWSTATELDNDYFVLERSSDGINFADVVQVAGAGNSSEQRDYSFFDAKGTSGDVYYRLTQVDYDGTCTTSDIIVAACRPAAAEPTISVYPNPFTDRITLTINNLPDAFDVEIVDNVGRVVYRNHFAAPTSTVAKFTLDLPELQAGVYNLRVQSKLFVVNKTIAKM